MSNVFVATDKLFTRLIFTHLFSSVLGYKIPKGWRVLCWLRYNHVNPEFFEDPLTFNPDRWDVR